jgi:hypothetical protein
MISPDKTGLLKSFLGSLPEEIAARLARAVEIDRLADGKALPHDMILEGLRPALRRLPGAERTLTPLRYFCVPFEDLFTLVPRSTVKQKGRISRGSVAPIWTWLNQTLLPEETRAYARDFKSAIVTGKAADAKARAEAYWPLAAGAMRDALCSDARREDARGPLTSELVVADAEEAALLLGVGSAVLKIQETLPRAVAALTDELLWSLRAIYDGLIETNSDAAPYVAVIAMNRLARPWEALKLPLSISRQTQDTLIASTDMGLVGEIIFGDIENYCKAVRDAKHPNFDADALVENISHFTSLSSGIVKGIEMRRDGKWGQRLMKDRTALAEVMDGFMERAPKELALALAYHKGATGGPKTADFSRPIDPEKIDRALRYARLVMGCKPFAVAGSFGASVKKAEEDMCQLLRSYNEDVVKELRTPDAKRRAVAESQFEFTVKLTATLFSEEESELLRRRGRAALGSAQAA